MDLKTELLKALAKTDLPQTIIEGRAGVSRQTIYHLLLNNNGRFSTIQNVFNALGYEIEVVKRHED